MGAGNQGRKENQRNLEGGRGLRSLREARAGPR